MARASAAAAPRAARTAALRRQVAQHRQHPPVVVGRGRQRKLGEHASHVRLFIAQLIYSLRTRCTPAELAHIVVVDNGSRDGSQQLLADFEQAGLCHVILNAEQRYHGPPLNQAMNWLVQQQLRVSEQAGIDYVWVLDSDCVVVRRDAIRKSTGALASSGAALRTINARRGVRTR